MSVAIPPKLQKALESLTDRDTGGSFEKWASVRGMEMNSKELALSLDIGYPLNDQEHLNLNERINACLKDSLAGRKLKLTLRSSISTAKVQAKLKPMREVRNIIAVASAKGGVGKSTVSVNLALGLSALGARVGLLDGDIYGPSQQMMLGIPAEQRPETRPPKYLLPIQAHNLQSMSIGYLLNDKTPLVWRGPMVSGALQQMVEQTLWKDLDYLVVDLPPGTGDIQLTLAQKVPLAGAIVVSTPQELALMDARRGIAMFEKVTVPVLGIVENMAYHLCKGCGQKEFIFGQDGGMKLASECSIPLLASVPLESRIGSTTDGGKPIVVAEPKSEAARIFCALARHVSVILASQPRAGADKNLDLRDITDAMA